jgi:hypothetical protein
MAKWIRITLLVVIGVIILAAIMFLIWALIYKPPVFFEPSPETETTTQEPGGLPPTGGTGVTTEIGGTETTPTFEVSTSEEAEKQRVKNLSVIFTERFGSFSNQGDFENITDLMPMMDSDMRAWAEQYISDNQPAGDELYYGISTKVITTDIILLDIEAGAAEFDLYTQRTESRSGQPDNVYYQTLNIEMIKLGNDWLISNARWE